MLYVSLTRVRVRVVNCNNYKVADSVSDLRRTRTPPPVETFTPPTAARDANADSQLKRTKPREVTGQAESLRFARNVKVTRPNMSLSLLYHDILRISEFSRKFIPVIDRTVRVARSYLPEKRLFPENKETERSSMPKAIRFRITERSRKFHAARRVRSKRKREKKKKKKRMLLTAASRVSDARR